MAETINGVDNNSITIKEYNSDKDSYVVDWTVNYDDGSSKTVENVYISSDKIEDLKK